MNEQETEKEMRGLRVPVKLNDIFVYDDNREDTHMLIK